MSIGIKGGLSPNKKPYSQQLQKSISLPPINHKLSITKSQNFGVHATIGLREIIEWFSGWKSWQQKLLLTTILDRCTRDQLASLMSSLEPISHRDFVQDYGRYPSAGFRRMYRRRERGLPYLQWPLKGQTVEGDGKCTGEEWNELLVSTANRLVIEVIATSIGRVKQELENYAGKVVTFAEDESTEGENSEISFSEMTFKIANEDDEENGSQKKALFLSEQNQLVMGVKSEKRESFVEEDTHKPSPPETSWKRETTDYATTSLRTSIKTADLSELNRNSLSGNAPITKKRLRHRYRPKNIFTWQLKEIKKFLEERADQERMRLLTELLHMSSKAAIHYCFHCITTRLFDKVNIHSLPHWILFRIFLYLNEDDLDNASEVCLRWYQLARCETVWRPRCEAFGRSEQLGDVYDLLRERFPAPVPIDWPLGYRYLQLAAVAVREAREAEEAARQAEQLAALDAMQKSKKDLWGPGSQGTTAQSSSVSFPTQFLSGTRQEKIYPTASAVSSAAGPEDITQTDELIDRRPLMKPILGRIKRFQESEDIALDLRPELCSKKDTLGMSEEKEHLHYRSQLARTGQPGTMVTFIRPVQICRRLLGHLDGIMCLQFDERRLVSGSMDRSLRLWDVQSGRSIHKFYGHRGAIICVHLKDNLLVSGSWDMLAMLWSLEPTFERIGVLYGHRNSVTMVRIVDNYVLTGSLDGTLRVYIRTNYKLSHTVDFGSGLQAGWCDGEQLITAHMDRSIRLASFPWGQISHILHGHRDPVLTLAVSGQLLVSGDQNGSIHFWHRYKGTHEASIEAVPGMILTSVVVHRGNFWTAHGDGSVREWHLPTMTCVRTLVGHKGSVRQVQVSGKRVASAGLDASIRIWDFRAFVGREMGEQELIKPKLIFPNI